MQYIPFVSLNNQTKSLFLIRPLLVEVDAIALNETPHRHTYQEILWIKCGVGRHTIDNQLFELKKNTFYIIYEGQVHHFIEGKNLSGFLIRFNNEFINSVSPLGHTNNHYFGKVLLNEFVVDEKDVLSFTQFLELIFEEYKEQETKNLSHNEIVQNLLKAFLVKLEIKRKEQLIRSLESIVEEELIDFEKNIYIKFVHLIESHFAQQKNVAFYTDKLAVSSRKLAEITRLFAGKLPKQMLLDRSILEAKRLLNFTEAPLKEISARLGYEEMSYFCRIFKNQTEFTPSEFRATVLKVL